MKTLNGAVKKESATKELVKNMVGSLLDGYRLILAEITYRMPDHPSLLQEFIWQELDLYPKLPVLNKFIAFWETSLDGKIFRVRVAWRGIAEPIDYRYPASEIN